VASTELRSHGPFPDHGNPHRRALCYAPPLRLKLYGEAVATVPAPISTLAPASTLPPTSTPTPTPDIALSLSGTQIMRGGQPITLVGAARYSLEFECHGDGHFQLSDFQAMRTWGMNTVRIPLSLAFWRNLDGKCPDYQALDNVTFAAIGMRSRAPMLTCKQSFLTRYFQAGAPLGNIVIHAS